MSYSSDSEVEISIAPNLTMRAYRYSGGTQSPVLCIHGLTRNAKDFADLAPQIAKTGHDVYALSLRGRGRSDYDPDFRNYHPITYRDDVIQALDTLKIDRAIFVGTSLGGIVTMLVNETSPERVHATIINDVGPELAPEGIARIAGYVGESGPAANLDEAAARIKAINAVAFPDMEEDFWKEFAKRTFRQSNDGSWELDYDLNIAKGLAHAGPAPDLWPAFESLKDTPTLVIRGAISDLLSPAIVERMRNVHAGFDYCEVPRVGHAPMMTEPEAFAAIQKLFDKLD